MGTKQGRRANKASGPTRQVGLQLDVHNLPGYIIAVATTITNILSKRRGTCH